MPKRPSPIVLAAAPLAAALLGGCEAISAGKIPGVYRIDVQQGNVVTQEMLNQLEPGMEKRKVRYVLGTPMIMDTFNEDRWDYVYSFEPGGGARAQRRISVFFEGEKLVRIDGDVKTGTASAPPAAAPRTERVVSVPDPEDEGFFRALTRRFRGGDDAAKAGSGEPDQPATGTTEDGAPKP